MILEYERRTNVPTRTGNVRFRVEEDGRVFVQANRREPPLDHDWSADYPAQPTATVDDARARIEAVLADHAFASMPPRTTGDRDDGYREQLTHRSADGATRTVIVDAARMPPFHALIKALTSMLGMTDEVR